MKPKRKAQPNPFSRPQRQAASAAPRRFKTLYGKPRTLTDRYDECSEEATARLLGKPEAELDWNDFNTLFRVGVAPATYEEGLYFVPDALAFLQRSPSDEGVNCVADVMWFLSEYAGPLEKDGLLNGCREQVLALLRERTAQFVVVHWDREMNRAKGFDRDHSDYVEDSQLICHTLEALLRFETLASWALEFLRTLGQAENEPLKSAWFLECVADARRWAFFRGKAERPDTTLVPEELGDAMPELRSLWAEFQARGFVRDCPEELAPDRTLLERHAQVVRRSGELFAKHPTYWADRFAKLGLSALTNPRGSEEV